MRLLVLALLAMIAAPAAAATAQPLLHARGPNASICPRTIPHFARESSVYRGQPIIPKKLTELPPAIGYMAVYRTVNGCEAPMTIIEYRTGRRR